MTLPGLSGGANGPGIDDVSRLLVDVHTRLSAHFAEQAAQASLTPVEAKVLIALAPGATTMSALAGELGLDPSNLTGVVDRLEQRDLVERGTRHDRRIRTVQPTQQGVSAGEHVLTLLTDQPGPLSHLADTERNQLRTLLRRVLDQ